jgi:hypothetical protein
MDGRDPPASADHVEDPTDDALTGGGGTGDNLAAPSGALFAFCERAGAMPIDRLANLLIIAQRYDEASIGDCRTTGLLAGLEDQPHDAWWDYLLNYSNALAGCPLIVTPLPGGIAAFGPGNTAAIGLPHPPFTREAAGLLIEKFLSAFSAGFGLAESERGLVEAHLWEVANVTIAEDATAWMSRCSDAGAVDSGVL